MNPEAARSFALFRRSGKTGGWLAPAPTRPKKIPTPHRNYLIGHIAGYKAKKSLKPPVYFSAPTPAM